MSAKQALVIAAIIVSVLSFGIVAWPFTLTVAVLLLAIAMLI